jgi:hypothetical protein
VPPSDVDRLRDAGYADPRPTSRFRSTTNTDEGGELAGLASLQGSSDVVNAADGAAAW